MSCLLTFFHCYYPQCISLMCCEFLNFLQVCGSTPCVRDTDHLFLELPLLREKLEKYIDETSLTGSWSQNAIHATNAWLKEGLKPRCITRDLKWGVPVPHEKYKDKVCHHLFVLVNTKNSKLYIVQDRVSDTCELVSGVLCLVWCTNRVHLHYGVLHAWVGEMVEESRKCWIVSVHG